MRYFYEAVDVDGKSVVGKIEAEDEREVQQRLWQQGLRMQAVAAQGSGLETVVGGGPSVTPATSATTASAAAQSYATGTVTTLPDRHVLTSAFSPTGAVTAAQTARSGSIILSGNAAKTRARGLQAKTRLTLPTITNPVNPRASKLGGVSTRDLLLFFQQLASLVRSGMTVFAALDNLAPRTPNRNLAQTAVEMAEAARSGRRISEVMEQYPRIYPEFVVGLVRAGELGGFLEIALAEAAWNYEENIKLYRHSWIPKLMATQAYFLLPFALPLFSAFYSADLNFGTFLANYLRQVGLIYLPASVALYFLVKWMGRSLQLPHLRVFRDTLALKIPPFGDLQRQMALAAFTRALRRLYQAGVAPIHAWEAALHTATNVAIRDRLARAYGRMQQGASLPDAFATTGLFSNQVENLIITGHHSGEVVESLDRIANYYEQQADETAGKSKFAMLRLGFLGMLVFGGGALCWLTYSYYHGMFRFVEQSFGLD